MAGSVALLPREIHVLDLGAGNLRRVKELAREHPKRTFVGVDQIAPKVLSRSHFDLPRNAYFVQRDIAEFLRDLNGAEVHVANADFVLHHLSSKSRGEVFQNLMRVVKPGGRFYVSHYLDNNDYTVAQVIEDAKRAGFEHKGTKPLLFLSSMSHSTYTARQSLGRTSANRFEEEVPDAPCVPTSVRITFVKPRE